MKADDREYRLRPERPRKKVRCERATYYREDGYTVEEVFQKPTPVEERYADYIRTLAGVLKELGVGKQKLMALID